MHVATKITLGGGSVLFLISVAVLVVGSNGMVDTFSEIDSNGDEYWTGNTPTTFSGELSQMSIYYVFIEEGRDVSVELIGEDAYSRFYPCDEDDSCDLLYVPGYTYVGDISVASSGTWEIKFSGDVVGDSDVMIRSFTMPINELIGMAAGCGGLCGALLLLIIGGVTAFTLKDKTKVQTTIQIDNEMVVIQEDPDESLYDQDETT
jgi:hypothetical protein